MSLHNPFIRLVAASLREEKFTCVDVGCSGGIETVWRLFGDRFRAIGFDISIDACKQLASQETQPDVHYVEGAVGIPPSHPFAQRVAGKPEHGDRLSGRLSTYWLINNKAKWLRQATLTEKLNANAWTLTELANKKPVYLLETFAAMHFDDVDFLKVDVDGSDFHILNSLDGQFDRLGILATRLEVCLTGGTDDTDNTFHNTDRFMRRQGYELVALDNRTYSARALPARFLYRMPAQTESGRLFQAEAFYARDPAGSETVAASLSAEKLAKLAAIYSAWDVPDGAAEILVTFRHRIAPLLDVDLGLDLLAAQTQRNDPQPRSYKDYMAEFERDDEALYPREPARPTLMQRLRAAWVALSDRYYISKIDLERRRVPAADLTLRAAAEDDAHAQFTLGLAYLHGDGVPIDRVQARKWFTIAAATAPSQAARTAFSASRDRLEQLMSSAEVKESDRLASSWKKGG